MHNFLISCRICWFTDIWGRGPKAEGVRGCKISLNCCLTEGYGKRRLASYCGPIVLGKELYCLLALVYGVPISEVPECRKQASAVISTPVSWLTAVESIRRLCVFICCSVSLIFNKARDSLKLCRNVPALSLCHCGVLDSRRFYGTGS